MPFLKETDLNVENFMKTASHFKWVSTDDRRQRAALALYEDGCAEVAKQ
jgi:hypothetical protein